MTSQIISVIIMSKNILTLMHSEWSKLYGVLTTLSAIGLSLVDNISDNMCINNILMGCV